MDEFPLDRFLTQFDAVCREYLIYFKDWKKIISDPLIEISFLYPKSGLFPTQQQIFLTITIIPPLDEIHFNLYVDERPHFGINFPLSPLLDEENYNLRAIVRLIRVQGSELKSKIVSEEYEGHGRVL